MRRMVVTGSVLVAFLMSVAAPVRAVDCEVSPYQAYLVAQPRGWMFQCIGLVDMMSGLAAAAVLHEPPNGLGCHWRTGWRASRTPRTVWLQFFGRNDGAGANGALRNGWRISAWELSGGSFVIESAENIRVHARMALAQHDRVYRYRVSRLILSHATEGCANVLDRAF